MDNQTFLALSTEAYLAATLREVYQNNAQALDILNRWTTLSINPATSQCTLTSQAMSTDGLIGQYSGNVTFNYTKRDLGVLLPYPFIFPLPYPTTYAYLSTYLLDTYGILIEDGDFAIAGNSVTTPLAGTDRIDALPDTVSGQVKLVAQAGSGRFVAGSVLGLRLTAPGVPVPLASVLALSTFPDLHLLTDKQ